MPENTLKEKQPGARNLAADVVQFLGWLTLVFAVLDLIRNGRWRTVVDMTLSADGRLLILLAGVAGVVVGWLLRHRK